MQLQAKINYRLENNRKSAKVILRAFEGNEGTYNLLFDIASSQIENTKRIWYNVVEFTQYLNESSESWAELKQDVTRVIEYILHEIREKQIPKDEYLEYEI